MRKRERERQRESERQRQTTRKYSIREKIGIYPPMPPLITNVGSGINVTKI